MVSSSVALTFDDGPWPERTLKLLEVLGARDAHATFFVWGEQALAHPEVVRKTLAAGHVVQPHCWNHRGHNDMSEEEIRADIDEVMALLRHLGVPSPHLWRPPWGYWLVGTTRELADERELALAGWTIDTTDYNGTPASTMYRSVVEQLEAATLSGADTVVLMHDSPLEPGQWAKRHDIQETIELVRRLMDDESRAFGPLLHGLWTNLIPVPPRS